MLNIFELTMVISIDHQSTTNNRLSPVMTTALVNTHTDQSIANLDSSHRNQISIEDNIMGKPTRTSVPRFKSHKPKGVSVNYVTILQDWSPSPLYANSITSCGHATKLRKPRVLLAFVHIFLTVCLSQDMVSDVQFRTWVSSYCFVSGDTF